MVGMSTSRRDFLKFAALLSGATGISELRPRIHPACARHRARSPARPSRTPNTSSSSCRRTGRLTTPLAPCRAFAASTIREPSVSPTATPSSSRPLPRPANPMRRGDWTSATRASPGWARSLTRATHRSMRGMRGCTTTGLTRRILPTATIETSRSRWAITRARTCLSTTRWPMHSPSATRSYCAVMSSHHAEPLDVLDGHDSRQAID